MKLNINNPFFQFLNTLCSFVALNLLFLITCIPIFTIGSAVTALYTVTLQEARQEHGYLIRTYLKAMKRNFKPATQAFFLLFPFAMILLFNMFFWASYGGFLGAVFLFLVTLVMMIVILTAIYTFPLLARFQNSAWQTIRNSYPLAMKHKKTTIILLFIHVGFLFLIPLLSYMKIFMILLGFSFIAFCCSFLFVKIFRNYEPESSNSSATEYHTAPF